MAMGTGYAFTTTLGLFAFAFRHMSRTTNPTIAISANGDFSVPPSGATITSFSASASDHGARLAATCSGGGLTAGSPYNLQTANSNAWLEVRAEL